MDTEKEKGVISQSDFADLKTVVEHNSKTIENIANMLAKQQSDNQKQQITADFSAPEYDHLNDEQKKQAADFCAGLSAEQREPYKKMLRELKPASATPPSGSVTAEFGAKGEQELSTDELIRQQVNVL